MTGQAEIRTRKGKGVDCGMGGGERISGLRKQSLCQGPGLERDLGKAREVARQETKGRVSSVRLKDWAKAKIVRPLYVLLRIWIFILRAKGCY